MAHYLDAILKELKVVLDNINTKELDALIEIIHKDRRIFVDGEGRSGFAGKGFAMRLMHIGYESYVIGETNTPSFQAGDILICISGSGNTGTVCLNAEKAKQKDVIVVGITTNNDSKLGEIANHTITVKATVRGDMENRQSIQLLGSLFDQSVHLILDSVCLTISKRDHISNEAATSNHV